MALPGLDGATVAPALHSFDGIQPENFAIVTHPQAVDPS